MNKANLYQRHLRYGMAVLFLLLFAGLSSRADIKLPAIISDNMVLQRDITAPIWGWAEPGEKVTVKASWQWLSTSTKTNANGQWMVKLSTPKAAGPHRITIRGTNEIALDNVLVGEVWVCSGQSNMQWSVRQSDNADAEIAAADFPQIRLFTVERKVAFEPQKDCTGQWLLCTPETIANFSAVAYFFGRELHKELNVPVGLIHTSWGGTPAEAWTKKAVLAADPDLAAMLGSIPPEGINPYSPAALYNAMIAPLIPYGIRGAIWYQGESNVGRASQYRKLFPAMIANWRDDWGQGDFPFYYVQIAPFKYPGQTDTAAAQLREAQLMTLSVPNTGMVVTTDIGNVDDIHPTNKQEVGRRLALWALAKTYGRKHVVYSGPIYRSMKVEKRAISHSGVPGIADYEAVVRLFFDYVDGGLVARDEPLTGFVIAGPDRNFTEAKAVIDGDAINVSNENVKDPVAVRFGYSNTATPNLFNKAHLPASPFRTDDWPD
jgi:sialate O-acetylesterase